jgi:hypothetical protein
MVYVVDMLAIWAKSNVRRKLGIRPDLIVELSL